MGLRQGPGRGLPEGMGVWCACNLCTVNRSCYRLTGRKVHSDSCPMRKEGHDGLDRVQNSVGEERDRRPPPSRHWGERPPRASRSGNRRNLHRAEQRTGASSKIRRRLPRSCRPRPVRSPRRRFLGQYEAPVAPPDGGQHGLAVKRDDASNPRFRLIGPSRLAASAQCTPRP